MSPKAVKLANLTLQRKIDSRVYFTYHIKIYQLSGGLKLEYFELKKQ